MSYNSPCLPLDRDGHGELWSHEPGEEDGWSRVELPGDIKCFLKTSVDMALGHSRKSLP